MRFVGILALDIILHLANASVTNTCFITVEVMSWLTHFELNV
jgi:hypothetical protein